MSKYYTCIEKVFLVYGSLRLGGIETLIVRFANYLESLSVEVFVCCSPGGRLESSLNDNVKVVHYKKTKELEEKVIGLDSCQVHHGKVLIISFDPISAARALTLENKFPDDSNVIHISGVFHPRAYFMSGERIDRIILNRFLASVIGKSRMFFMNEECRDSHSSRWSTDLIDSSVIPLPINCTERKWRTRSRREVRIVSVGRLVDFKKYNIGIPDIVKACRQEGLDVSWDVYGDGPLREAVEVAVCRAGMSEHVRLLGSIDYKDFPDKILDYDLFVGMGSAALEASAVGVPSICALVDETYYSYGYIYKLPFGNVGESIPGRELENIADLIIEYYCSDTDRNEVSKLCFLAAKKYSMEQFCESIFEVGNSKRETRPILFRRLLGFSYNFVLDSNVFEKLRKAIN